ncbi:glycoside hydrolase family 16 protein [Shewanella sp.]|uniref:glycoside hydrolase family 16 protein n=1 Tax=Shewanella sp. TaxID=50422 RepID=UPI0025865EA6|nr:glycoside hydrolase family 16 protein [Shewanella sp.]MCJ8304560.1 glycoside hydrolase family 16 protein [Shewanella sp.]
MKSVSVKLFCSAGLVASISFASQGGSVSDELVEMEMFFDDFSYSNLNEFYDNGWKVRTETGHPGISGASWSADGISFVTDVDGSKGSFIRMSSVTAGEGENTRHTQFCHERKYLNGTYAARVFFRDEPTYGPDGDEVIQTFYTISPLASPMDPEYSEVDFEYLPNGGWGSNSDPAMWTTTWETFQLTPWTKVNEYTRKPGSNAGWKTLLMTVEADQVNYYVDGQLISTHSDKVAPEQPMSINFNLWFMPKGADGSIGPVDSDEMREYRQDIDWVFHIKGALLSTAEVKAYVTQFRDGNLNHFDRVPELTPALASPCGL